MDPAQGVRLADVRNMDDARALARHIVATKNFDESALRQQEPRRDESAYWQAQSLLADDIIRSARGGGAPQQPPSAAPAAAPAAPSVGEMLHALAAPQQVDDQPRSDIDDSLPNSPGGEREGSAQQPGADVPALLAAVEQAVRQQAGLLPAQHHAPQHPPQVADGGVQRAAQPALPAPGGVVQAQLEQQARQLEVLTELQRRLLQQQEVQAHALAAASRSAPQGGSPYRPPREVSPHRQRPLLQQRPQDPLAVPVFGPPTPRGLPTPSGSVIAARRRAPMPAPPTSARSEAVAAAAEAEAARQRAAAADARLRREEEQLRAAMQSLRLGHGALEHPQPPSGPLPAPPPPPPPPHFPATADGLAAWHSMGSAAAAGNGTEELEAREQAHRITAECTAQRNLSIALTEQLAQRTQEVEGLRQQLAGGGPEGAESARRLAETLACYERELSQERARTLAMEHEVQRLHGELERRGLPAPRSRRDYEEEMQALQQRIAHQDLQLAELRRRAEEERAAALASVELRHSKVVGQEQQDLRREVSLLRAKLKEKKQVNQELQDMLRLHLRYNSEANQRSVLSQPQWLHPVMRESQPPQTDSAFTE